MGIRDWFDRVKERRQREREAFDDVNTSKIVQERQLSSNERELLKFKKKEHEARVKLELEHYRKKEKFDIEHNHNPIKAPVIFDHGYSMLKEKNIFQDQPNIFMKNKGLFFNG